MVSKREKARKITLECRLIEEIKEKPLEAFVDFTRGKAFGFYDYGTLQHRNPKSLRKLNPRLWPCNIASLVTAQKDQKIANMIITGNSR